MKKQFEVAVEKETLIFSAAHFITFGDQICESLHGHNYRVACRVRGELDGHACVIDFIWLRDRLQEISSRLDHQVLLPDRHPHIHVEQRDQEYHVRFESRRWVFPAGDVTLLPVDNTTAERLAEYIGELLLEPLQQLPGSGVQSFRVGVDENEGQWAWCEFQVSNP